MKICFKTVSWRTIGSGTTFLVTWVVTGNVRSGLTIGLIDMGANFILYYIHEHVWMACTTKKTIHDDLRKEDITEDYNLIE